MAFCRLTECQPLINLLRSKGQSVASDTLYTYNDVGNGVGTGNSGTQHAAGSQSPHMRTKHGWLQPVTNPAQLDCKHLWSTAYKVAYPCKPQAESSLAIEA